MPEEKIVTKNVLGKQNTAKCENILLSEKPARRDTYLENLVRDESFKKFLSEKYGIKLSNDFEEGGFSVVSFCDGNGDKSVMKFSSFRCLANIKSTVRLGDISEDTQTSLRTQVMSYFARERSAYDLLNETRNANEDYKWLVSPFVLTVSYPDNKTGKEEIYDYVFCMNLPRYTDIHEHLKGVCDEKMALTIAYDVLTQLRRVHQEGVRHRDIKMGNIMYDDKYGKYVLIDWGASCNLSDSKAAKIIYERANEQACTPIYVDPVRFNKDEDANKPYTDLFSLGVLLAYLLHKKGYNAGKNIKEFYEEVSSGVTVGEFLTMREDICDDQGLEVSDAVRNIIRRAMQHKIEKAYEDSSDMLHDVKLFLGIKEEAEPEKNVKRERKKKEIKKVNVNLVYSVIPFAIAVIWSLISGFDGSGFSVPMGILCLLVPAMIILRISGNERKFTVNLSDFIQSMLFILLSFIVTSSQVSLALKGLNISCPFGWSCINIIFLCIVCLISVKTGHKTLIRTAGCAISGIIGGCCTAVCLGETFADCAGIITKMTCAGIIWGLIFGYFVFMYETRLIPKK